MTESHLLNRFKFFAGTTDEQRSAIAECLEVKNIPPRVTLFKTGESSLHLYALLEGEVALSLIATDKIMKADIVGDNVYCFIGILPFHFVLQGFHATQSQDRCGWGAA